MKDTTMAANQDFQYDVFLSHSAKDKAVVRASSLSASNGERAGVRCGSPLWQDGLKMWFDGWEIAKAASVQRSSTLGLQPFPAAPIKGSLAQFLYVNWRTVDRRQDIVADSKFWKHLTAGHNDRKLDDDAWNRFSTQMDTCVRRRGHHSEEQDKELANRRKRLAALEKLCT